MSDSLGILLNFDVEKGIVAESWAELLVLSIPKKVTLLTCPVEEFGTLSRTHCHVPLYRT